jgi:hypothetical protein
MCDLDKDRFIREPSDDVDSDEDDDDVDAIANDAIDASAARSVSAAVLSSNVNQADNDDDVWRRMTPLVSLRARLGALVTCA